MILVIVMQSKHTPDPHHLISFFQKSIHNLRVIHSIFHSMAVLSNYPPHLIHPIIPSSSSLPPKHPYIILLFTFMLMISGTRSKPVSSPLFPFFLSSSFPTNSIPTTKYLSKRMYAIECARNGSSYGLLISSNSLLNLPSTIHHLLDRIKALLHQNERQYYTFLMNTLSITKLNNFEQNIDTYVLCSSCSESLWLSPEHKQFNIPLISIADVVHAFGLTDENSPLKYSFDLRQILSMIHLDEQSSSESNQELVLKNPNSLLLQQRDGHQRGLESGPKWWGLQINDQSNDEEQQPIAIAELKEGRTGIAAGYTHEKS